MNRKIDLPDQRILDIEDKLKQKIPEFKQKLIEKSVYIPEDPEDVSIIPRVINREEEKKIFEICKEITETAFGVLGEYLNGSAKIPSSTLNDFLATLSRKKQTFIGNARYDFLKQDNSYKLVEMNFVNVGALIESTEAPASILEIFPELNDPFTYKSPVAALKKRLEENSVSRIIILTNSDLKKQYTNLTDRKYIKTKIGPIECLIVPEGEYDKIKFNSGRVFYDGTKIDAIYPRHLDGTDESIYRNKEFCDLIINSDVLLVDNFLTMLLEDKDLRFLSKYNSKLKEVIPEIYDVSELKLDDYSDYVLKLKDTHCGKGVIISPKDIENKENAILEERIYANLYPVYTIEGNNGKAPYDTGVYISYHYDMRKGLEKFEVSGYLTRFSLKSDIVNLSRGGGLIPVLIEK